MIEAPRLLKDLKRLLKTLEDDIRERLDKDAALQATLRQEWKAARDAGRTARTEADWIDEEITQGAAHWILGCVFLRFIEDNGLVPRPWLAGPGDRLVLALDRHEAYFRAHPHDSDREYMAACFREAEELPGVGALYDEAHNPLWRVQVSGVGAMALRTFFQRVEPDTGALNHDFSDPAHGTRFLGDLYQDLSEAAKKRYALLQTPEFVERFILDRTLTPAIDQFGYREVRLIDPACGSGHFLLDAFHRLFETRVMHEPTLPLPAAAQAALDAVAGVDINPFAVAIARFRLLVAALKASRVNGLKNAPDFKIPVATGDSLLHGRRFDRLDLGGAAFHSRAHGIRHVTRAEDREAIDQILGRQYHVVAGNPPYNTATDPALNQAYRDRYTSCHLKFSLVVPFIERFFDLALPNSDNPAGFVGMIVANSFMKREFGKKLIEQFLPTVDLTHVVDTIDVVFPPPGFGTPTAILFGRHRHPVSATVRTVMGIKGESTPPSEPARGRVWLAILEQIDQVGSESAFVSVADMPRTTFAKHPWSIGGGGVADLREMIQDNAKLVLSQVVDTVGVLGMTNADEVMIADRASFRRKGVSTIKKLLLADEFRDWSQRNGTWVYFPYDSELLPLERDPHAHKWLWPTRTTLGNRATFSKKTYFVEGRAWWSWHQISLERLTPPMSIVFAEIATHNHFLLDRGGKLFKQTAPLMKLPHDSSEDDHLALLGLLNSSTACFWGRQTLFAHSGARDGKWEERLAWGGTKIEQFPVPESRPTDLTRALDRLGRELCETLPKAVLAHGVANRADLDAARKRMLSIRRQMVALQEELDWRCYRLYGLLDEAVEHPKPPEIDPGQRAFEIIMARQMVAGVLDTTWFERHGSTPITELPSHWPADYHSIVEKRIALIEENKWIGLVERPEYKRRWQWRPWEEQEKDALRESLLNLLEDTRYWGKPPAIQSVNRLADRARGDANFMTAAALYTGRPDFTVAKLARIIHAI
jgi:hypothetical protein